MIGLWTDEIVERLKTLWPTLSASQIAADLGRDGHAVTRNAVIGKAHRLGLGGKVERAFQAPIKPRKPPRVNYFTSNKRAGPSTPPAVFTPRIVDTGPRHLTLLELTEAVCKYECSGAIETHDYTFCGQPIGGDPVVGPYCSKHNAICRGERPTRRKKPFWRGAA